MGQNTPTSRVLRQCKGVLPRGRSDAARRAKALDSGPGCTQASGFIKTHPALSGAKPQPARPGPDSSARGAPGRVRPPPWEDALAPPQDAHRQSTLHHKPRGTIVAGVPPRSDSALRCAGLRAGKARETPTQAPPWPEPRALAPRAASDAASGACAAPWGATVPLAPREDALAPSQDAGRRKFLHHKPRGTTVAGVPPRSDAALWVAGLAAGEKCDFPTKAVPPPPHGRTRPLYCTGQGQVGSRPDLTPPAARPAPRIARARRRCCQTPAPHPAPLSTDSVHAGQSGSPRPFA